MSVEDDRSALHLAVEIDNFISEKAPGFAIGMAAICWVLVNQAAVHGYSRKDCETRVGATYELCKKALSMIGQDPDMSKLMLALGLSKPGDA